jgi:hypothetical protein
MTTSGKKEAAQGLKGKEKTRETSHVSEYHFFVSGNGVNGADALSERRETKESSGEGVLKDKHNLDFFLPE